MSLLVVPTLYGDLLEAQLNDDELKKIREKLQDGKTGEFSLNKDGILTFKGRICVPSSTEVKRKVLEDGHKSRFAIHPGSTKMYQDLKRGY